MGMTQPKRRLTSSTQRGGRSSGSAWRSRSMAPLPEPAGPAWLPAQLPPGGPKPGMLGLAATAAGRTSCPPSGHPAPGVAALPPGSPGSATQRGRAEAGARQGREPGAGKGYSRPMLPLSRPSPSPSSCLGLQLPPALLPATLVSVPSASGGGAQWHPPPEGLCVLTGSGGLLPPDLVSLAAHRCPD